MAILVRSTSFPDVKVIESQVFGDHRGVFFESFNARDFAALVAPNQSFVQDNHSHSVANVLRGLHYQVERPQAKLVRVVAGEIFDVVVDLRRGSATYGQWEGMRLSADNRLQLWIPCGFAHGFLTLSASADVLYKTTDYRYPALERTIAWDDAALAIDWPLDVRPTVSARDASGQRFIDAETFN